MLRVIQVCLSFKGRCKPECLQPAPWSSISCIREHLYTGLAFLGVHNTLITAVATTMLVSVYLRASVAVKHALMTNWNTGNRVDACYHGVLAVASRGSRLHYLVSRLCYYTILFIIGITIKKFLERYSVADNKLRFLWHHSVAIDLYNMVDFVIVNSWKPWWSATLLKCSDSFTLYSCVNFGP